MCHTLGRWGNNTPLRLTFVYFNNHYLTLNFRTAGRVLKGDVQKMKVALENTAEDVMERYVAEFDNGKVAVEGFGEFDSELFVKNAKSRPEFILDSKTESLSSSLVQLPTV